MISTNKLKSLKIRYPIQGSRHHTPEHCLVNGGMSLCLGGKKSNMFQLVAKKREKVSAARKRQKCLCRKKMVTNGCVCRASVSFQAPCNSSPAKKNARRARRGAARSEGRSSGKGCLRSASFCITSSAPLTSNTTWDPHRLTYIYRPHPFIYIYIYIYIYV